MCTYSNWASILHSTVGGWVLPLLLHAGQRENFWQKCIYSWLGSLHKKERIRREGGRGQRRGSFNVLFLVNAALAHNGGRTRRSERSVSWTLLLPTKKPVCLFACESQKKNSELHVFFSSLHTQTSLTKINWKGKKERERQFKLFSVSRLCHVGGTTTVQDMTIKRESGNIIELCFLN